MLNPGKREELSEQNLRIYCQVNILVFSVTRLFVFSVTLGKFEKR